MRIAYSGCRPPRPDAPRADHDLYERIEEDAVYDVMQLPAGTTVVHGNAEGVDAAVRDAARELGLPDEPWLPDPGAHGGDFRKALLARNVYVTTVGADGEARFYAAPWSRGTYHAHTLAVKAGVPRRLREYLPDGGVKVTRWPPGPPQRLRVKSGGLRWYNGPGRLDVTRGSARGPGEAFAPTRAILDPALGARHAAQDLHVRADAIRTRVGLFRSADAGEAAALSAQAWALEEAAFAVYREAFLGEMRVSAGMKRTSPRWGAAEEAAVARGVVPRPEVWQALLAGKLGSYDTDGAPLVVACCFCDLERMKRGLCHTCILRQVWAAMGAEDGGIAKGRGAVAIVCR